ncbi:MAG: hypothetical protein EOP84_30500, partial [Verrucomicrobiaceae bacterium]
MNALASPREEFTDLDTRTAGAQRLASITSSSLPHLTPMRLSQSQEATKEFIATLESHFATLHPDYQRNRMVKGIRHEYLREIERGLFAIHSVICIRGTYYHCFCLSLHRTHATPYLYSPFTVGGRCDHGYTVTRACHCDLGLSPIDPIAPFRMSDSHKFRVGADHIIQRCLGEAESRLLPYYLSVWGQTRPALQSLLDYATATPPEEISACAAAYL